MTDIVKDVSTVTQIPESLLKKLTAQEIHCICNCVYEAKLKDEPVVEVNIGIGTLLISVTDTSARYKFIPSKLFEKTLLWTVDNNKSPLVQASENSLTKRVEDAYKELM